MKAACVVLMSLALACDGANPPTELKGFDA
jgi:hypothetical protein